MCVLIALIIHIYPNFLFWYGHIFPLIRFAEQIMFSPYYMAMYVNQEALIYRHWKKTTMRSSNLKINIKKLVNIFLLLFFVMLRSVHPFYDCIVYCHDTYDDLWLMKWASKQNHYDDLNDTSLSYAR